MTLRKHGSHLAALDLPKLAIAAANDTSTLLTYWNAPAGVFDPSAEFVIGAVLTCDAAVTGAATNNFAVEVKHYNSAGVLQNRVVYTFGNGTNATAFVPIDLSGPATGALTNPTGIPIQQGWQLAQGDSIVVLRASNGTGLASPAFTVTLFIAQTKG